jgi:hypothetical protein
MCGAVVEDALREAGGHGFESERSNSVTTLHEKMRNSRLNRWGPYHKNIFFY